LTLGPGGWGSPGTIDPTGTAESVSCVSASFCVALSARESEGQQRTEAFTWRGSGWSGPAEVSAHSILRSISCVSEAFCVAVGGSEAALFTGGSWQAPAVVAAGSFLRSVSCASAAFCEAVGEHPVNIAEHVAEGVTYDGAGWSEPQEIPSPPDRLALSPGPASCPTTSFCMAGGAFEAAGATLEAGVWAPWAPLEINDGFTSMSCPAATLCIGVTEEGQAFLYGAAGSPPATGSVPVQTSPPGTAGTGGTAAYTADRALPRLELLGRPRLNRRS